jgi:hypothetical protein
VSSIPIRRVARRAHQCRCDRVPRDRQRSRLHRSRTVVYGRCRRAAAVAAEPPFADPPRGRAAAATDRATTAADRAAAAADRGRPRCSPGPSRKTRCSTLCVSSEWGVLGESAEFPLPCPKCDTARWHRSPVWIETHSPRHLRRPACGPILVPHQDSLLDTTRLQRVGGAGRICGTA